MHVDAFIQATDGVVLLVAIAMLFTSHGKIALGVLGLWIVCVLVAVLLG